MRAPESGMRNGKLLSTMTMESLAVQPILTIMIISGESVSVLVMSHRPVIPRNFHQQQHRYGGSEEQL